MRGRPLLGGTTSEIVPREFLPWGARTTVPQMLEDRARAARRYAENSAAGSALRALA